MKKCTYKYLFNGCSYQVLRVFEDELQVFYMAHTDSKNQAEVLINALREKDHEQI